MSKLDRSSKFCRAIDKLDREIIALILKRDALMDKAPDDYDCDGEGEDYAYLLGKEAVDSGRAEAIFHAIAKVD